MEFSTGISTNFDTSYQFNAVDNYNKFLQENSSFKFDESTPTEFEQALEKASKSFPINDKHLPDGLGNFASQFGTAFGQSLNAVNNMKITADRMQEDIALGGPTNIHDKLN